MDLLPLHIEYLLTRHDCVIVPGLGAFIATEHEASFDLESNLVRPRRREISFNGSVVTDDGLLAHSIARRERLSYEDARKLLSTLTERLSADLAGEGEVSLGMTGKLAMDSEGLITFHPRRSAILSDIMPEVRLEERKTAVAVEAPETAAAAAAEEEEDGMRTIRVRADRYVFTVSKRAVHAAAMLVTILTVGLSLLMPINHDNEQKASVISIEEFFRRPVKNAPLRSKDTREITVEKNDSTAPAEAPDTL